MRVVMALTERAPEAGQQRKHKFPHGCGFKDYSHKLLISLKSLSLSHRQHKPREAAQIHV